MQPRPSFDIEILIVVVVNVLVILGLGWVLLTNESSESSIPPTVELTVIPSDVTSLEPGMPPSPPSATPNLEKTPPTVTASSPVSYPGPPAETLPSASTLVSESQTLPSATPTPDQALLAGKHDDTDPRIDYDRHWTFRMNSSTEHSYKGTMHMSTGIGNEASFRFTGQQFYLGYQRGRSFGTVRVMIDGELYSFHEQAFDLIWRSPQLSPGTHTVRIIHESGESINLDYIEVLD